MTSHSQARREIWGHETGVMRHAGLTAAWIDKPSGQCIMLLSIIEYPAALSLLHQCQLRQALNLLLLQQAQQMP